MFYLSVFLPLVSFFTCMILNKRISDLKIEGLISLLMIICSLISLYLFFYVYHYGSDSPVTLGSWLTSGSFYIDWSLNYNSLSVYDYELNLIDSYNKIKLVPFGEFLPLENILKRIGLKTITNNYQSYSKGDERNTIHIEKEKLSLRILPLICYEIIYSGDLFSNLNFDFIVNISEDGWFGKSIGPEQHFVHSIFRAIESGKYIVRSSNNGIAAIINPIGIIEEKVEFGNTGYVDLKENRKIQSTIFSKLGNKIFLIIILFYVLLIFLLIKLQKEKN